MSENDIEQAEKTLRWISRQGNIRAVRDGENLGRGFVVFENSRDSFLSGSYDHMVAVAFALKVAIGTRKT